MKIKNLKKTLIGDRAFYAAVLALIIPVMIQSTITSFVSLLDNLMVGALGDRELSGVAIANQLIFVFNLCIFGGLSGAGIFGAQFYGAGNVKGHRETFRIKLLVGLLLSVFFGLAVLLSGNGLIRLFLQGDGDPRDAEAMLAFGRQYLLINLLGIPAFAVTQSYAGTLRECGETRLPMLASLAAIATNVVFNWLLIFGVLFFPRLGVAGAAIATVLSRYVECAILAVCTLRRKRRFAFIQGAWQHVFTLSPALVKKVARIGLPLLVNEALWSAGMSTLTAIYSHCGLNVVGALSITSTISNLFNQVFFSLGTAVSVMVGQALGSKDYARARAIVWKLLFFAVVIAILTGAVLYALSPVIPLVYTGVTEDVRALATQFLQICALAFPLYSFAHCSYFTLRAGGKTVITFFFDCVYTWVISVCLAWVLIHLAQVPILSAYAAVQFIDILKCILGYWLIRKGVWIQHLSYSDEP